MRILQVVLADASEYERKSQRVDREAFAPQHEVLVATMRDARTAAADVAHLYAGASLPARELVGFPLPYVASSDVQRSRWPFRRAVEPDYVVSPAFENVEQSRLQPLPEAVEEAYFAVERAARGGSTRVIGAFRRAAVLPLIEQIQARITRYRDDVRWELFDRVPAPEDLAAVDVWADPAVDERDFDGFVAEALVVGLPVVAAHTRMNARRLEQGRTGFLTPIGDQNETTHAILTALFKTEAAQQKLIAARQTISRFRARQRARVLLHMYETLTS